MRPFNQKFLRQTGLHLRVRPFEVEQLQPVVLESELERRMEQIQEAVERHARGGGIRAGASYDAQAFTAETGYSADQLEGWIDQLQRKQQLILYGPPGTGKTYLAERLARYLVDGGGFSELVQFHTSYAYEDFVQGTPATGGRGRTALRIGRRTFSPVLRQGAPSRRKALCANHR